MRRPVAGVNKLAKITAGQSSGLGQLNEARNKGDSMLLVVHSKSTVLHIVYSSTQELQDEKVTSIGRVLVWLDKPTPRICFCSAQLINGKSAWQMNDHSSTRTASQFIDSTLQLTSSLSA